MSEIIVVEMTYRICLTKAIHEYCTALLYYKVVRFVVTC